MFTGKKIFTLVFVVVLVFVALAIGVAAGYYWGFNNEKAVLDKKLAVIHPLRDNTSGYKFIDPLLALVSFKKENWKWAWIFSIFIGVLVSFVGIIQYYGLFNRIFLSVPSSPPSTMGNPDILALYLLLLSFMAMSFGIKWQKAWEKIFCFSSLVIFLFTILITGCRAVYLGIIIGAVYFLLFYPKKIKVVKAGAVGLLVVVVGIVFYVNATNQFPGFLQQNRIFDYVSARLSIKRFLADPRFDAWQIGLSAIKTRPLLGYGPENFSVGFDRYYDPSIPNLSGSAGWYDRAHDIILQTGSDAGILGILAYLALFIILFWQLQKLKTAEAHGIQATLIGYFVANLFGFDSSATYLIFFFIIAHALYLTTPGKETVPSGKTIKARGIIIGTLFLALIIFLWQYNLVPLEINAQINKASDLADSKQCDQALGLIDKTLQGHSFLDSYVRAEYVDFEKTCAVFYPENNLTYIKRGFELMNEAVKIQPLYTRYWIYLGNSATAIADTTADEKTKNNLLKEANDYFNKALQLAPKHQEILVGLAELEMVAGDYNKAQNYSEQCVALSPTLGDCYWYLGISDIYLKDNVNADKNILLASQKGYNVNAEISLAEMASAYSQASDYQDLVATFEKLVKANPNNAQYHSSLAFIYAKLGEYDKARQEAATVLQLSPQSKDSVDAFLKTLP